MTEKRDKVNVEDIIGLIKTDEPSDSVEEVRKLRGRDDNNFYWYKKYKEVLNENEQLKSEIENLKITIDARDTLIEVCEKKFRELGLIISVDDDGYVIE